MATDNPRFFLVFWFHIMLTKRIANPVFRQVLFLNGKGLNFITPKFQPIPSTSVKRFNSTESSAGCADKDPKASAINQSNDETDLQNLNLSEKEKHEARKQILSKFSSSKINSLTDILVESIKLTGSLSISTFMKQCLTNPDFGYYTTKDPLANNENRGDFVTSPEISQMFGEMIGVWYYTVFLHQSKTKSLENIQLIEFGPGKGTLMHDVLKSFNALAKKQHRNNPILIIMVEASPVLIEKQYKTLCDPNSESIKSFLFGKKSTTKWGNDIYWVLNELDILDLQKELKIEDSVTNFVLCHEFFDALPIKQFKKSEKGWYEYLVDFEEYDEDGNLIPKKSSIPTRTDDGRDLKQKDEKESTENLLARKIEPTGKKEVKFHLTLSPKVTTASYVPKSSPRHDMLPLGSRVEISPETLTYGRRINELIYNKQEKSSGAALYIDYGSAEVPLNTLRGIKNHKFVSPFEDVGNVDLSADVDFGALKYMSHQDKSKQLDVFGPVEQGTWLNLLGLQYRTQMLVNKETNNENKQKIIKSYYRLVEDMGKIYKFMAILPKGGETPVGFGGGLNEQAKNY